MAMTRKKRRMILIGIGAAFLASASLLVGVGMRDSIVFFLSPTEIAERAPGPDQRLRVGGLVEEGSVAPMDGGGVRFAVSDGATVQVVEFAGILPDLFAEGQGVIAEGRMRDGLFVASEVLAKHDEKYMPREVEAALKEQGVYRMPSEDGDGRAVAEPGTGG
ncbi:MAG: cytochrome c maturation protein CcmE [Rhodobacteraceae bacterium]|nr:cytochrome c maturation protein CcmE [Paracoccaceae bacterium]MBR26466.1 cytochrome c maturation protein CcmE [Paracoccaceae bacterium]|tara:strand:+ start:41 stop:526 length:486 start_codon:yes stop_codon:yes gene_type:complete